MSAPAWRPPGQAAGASGNDPACVATLLVLLHSCLMQINSEHQTLARHVQCNMQILDVTSCLHLWQLAATQLSSVILA